MRSTENPPCAFDLVTAIISGQSWMGHVPCTQLPVLIADYENPEDYTRDNLFPMLEERGVDPADVDHLYHCVEPDKIFTECTPIGEEYAVNAIEHIKEKTGKNHGLMIIDTARPAFTAMHDDPGWENGQVQVRMSLDIARRIAKRTGWGVLVIHHTNKAGTSASGAGDWEGASDYVLTYERNMVVKPNVSTLSFLGRSAHPPEPISYTKPTALLKGCDLSEKKAESKQMDMVQAKNKIKPLLPDDESRAISGNAVVNAYITANPDVPAKERLSKNKILEVLVWMVEQGICSRREGAKNNAVLYWKIDPANASDEPKTEVDS